MTNNMRHNFLWHVFVLLLSNIWNQVLAQSDFSDVLVPLFRTSNDTTNSSTPYNTYTTSFSTYKDLLALQYTMQLYLGNVAIDNSSALESSCTDLVQMNIYEEGPTQKNGIGGLSFIGAQPPTFRTDQFIFISSFWCVKVPNCGATLPLMRLLSKANDDVVVTTDEEEYENLTTSTRYRSSGATICYSWPIPDALQTEWNKTRDNIINDSMVFSRAFVYEPYPSANVNIFTTSMSDAIKLIWDYANYSIGDDWQGLYLVKPPSDHYNTTIEVCPELLNTTIWQESSDRRRSWVDHYPPTVTNGGVYVYKDWFYSAPYLGYCGAYVPIYKVRGPDRNFYSLYTDNRTEAETFGTKSGFSNMIVFYLWKK